MLTDKELKTIKKKYPEGVRWPKSDMSGEMLNAICHAHEIGDVHIFSNDTETVVMCRTGKIAEQIQDAVENTSTATIYKPEDHDELLKDLDRLSKQ